MLDTRYIQVGGYLPEQSSLSILGNWEEEKLTKNFLK